MRGFRATRGSLLQPVRRRATRVQGRRTKVGCDVGGEGLALALGEGPGKGTITMTVPGVCYLGAVLSYTVYHGPWAVPTIHSLLRDTRPC